MRFLNNCYNALFLAGLLTSGSACALEDEAICQDHYVRVALVNKTNNSDVSDIYFLAKGMQIINGKSNGKHCYVKFDKTSLLGECEEATNESDPSFYSYKVSDFPNGVCMPLVESGRVYFSLNYPLNGVRVIKTEQGTPSIIDPDPFNPKDQDYYKFWDKIEFSFLPVNGVDTIWTNPTAVDFFSIPIRIELDKIKYPENFSGFMKPKSEIFKSIRGTFKKYEQLGSGKAWNALFLYSPGGTDDNHIMRLISPGKAILKNVQSPEHTFDPVYLSNENAYGFDYIDSVWKYYQDSNNFISVDVSELNSHPQGQDIMTGQVTTVYDQNSNLQSVFKFIGSKGIYKDQIVQFSKPVVLKTGQGESPEIPLDPVNYEPGSRPFFAGAGLRDENASLNDFDSKSGTKMVGPIIQRAITSAFDVGMLPAPSIRKIEFANASEELKKYYTNYTKAWSEEDEIKYGVLINKDYFEFARHITPSLYYKNDTLNSVYPDQINKGPWFDLYSEALHRVGEPIYTFAYDDALGQDGTLSLPNPGKLVVNIGDMSGSVIPKLEEDEGVYNYEFHMAKIGGQNGKYPEIYRCITKDVKDIQCSSANSHWEVVMIPQTDGVVKVVNQSPMLLKNNDRIIQISARYKVTTAITKTPVTQDLASAINIRDCGNDRQCVALEFPAF